MLAKRRLIALLLSAFAALSQAGAQTWDGGATGSNNQWSGGGQNPNNWNPDGAPANNGSADLIFDGINRLNPVMNGNWSINSLTFASTAGDFVIGPSAASDTLTIQSGGVTNNDAGTQTLNVNTALGSAQTWISSAGTVVIGSSSANRTLANNGHTLTLAGAGNIFFNAQFSGSGGLVKNGTGTATLSFGSADDATLSVYSGPTTVNSGTLIVDIGGNFGTPATPLNGAITVGSSDGSGTALMELRYLQQIGDTNTVRVNRTGTLRLSATTYADVLNETVGAITLEGGGRIETVDGPSNSATFTLNGNVTRVAVGAPSAEISGRLNLNGGTRTFDVANSDADVDLLVSAVISGAGGSNLIKTGAGTLHLTGNNSYAGDTTINAGVLRASSASALGAANFNNTVAAGAALEFAGNFTLNETGLTLTGSGLGGTGALRSVSGSNAYNNQLQLNAGGVSVGVDAGAALSLGGAVNGGTLTKVGDGTLTFSGGTAYNASGLVVNAGTVILGRTANSNFVGSTVTVNDGVLRLAANQQIADFQTVTVNAPGVFDLDGRNETITALVLGGGAVTTGAGTLTFINSATPVTSTASATTASISGSIVLTSSNSAFSVADGAAATDLSVTASIASSGGFQQFLKTGAGTLALSGNNTFTTAGFGGVRVQGGVLQISADNNLGNANNRVLLEGGTFRAAGTFTTAAARVFETTGPGGTINVTAGNTLTLNTADRLRGSAPLTKTGDGILALNEANANFTGNATLSGGITRLGNHQALGTSTSATHTVGPGATLEAAFSNGTNFQANLVLAGGTLVRTSTANQKAGFQNNNAGSSLTVTADSIVRDASNDAASGFITFDGVVNVNPGVVLTVDAVTSNSEVRFGGTQNIVIGAGATLATTGDGLVSLGSASARTIVAQGTTASQSTLSLGAADHTSNTGSRFQVNGSGIGGLRVEGTQSLVDAFLTDTRLAATTGSGGTFTIAYADAGSRTLGATANLAAASNLMLGLESAGGTFTLDGSLANWGGLVVGPSTTVSFGVSDVFSAGDSLVMRGGTLTLGDTSQSFGSFEVLGSSILDFGGGDGTLNAGTLSISNGTTLTVRNWTESADAFFSQFDPGAANLARVYFEAQDKSGSWNKVGSPFEIIPVPEPSSSGALAVGGLVAMAALRRRRHA